MFEEVLNDAPSGIESVPSSGKRKRSPEQAIVLRSIVDEPSLHVAHECAPEVAVTSSTNIEPARKKRNRRKKKDVKGKEKAIPVAEKPVAPATKVAKDKKTKRGHGFDSLFADGTFVVVKISERIVTTLSEEAFVACCQKAELGKRGVKYGPLSKQYWFLRYKTADEAESVVGRKLLFGKELGLKEDVEVEVMRYLAEGPKAFSTDRVGPFDDLEIQAMLERKFPSDKYWLGLVKRGEFESPHRLLLELPKAIYSFELGEEKGFLVRFRAVDRGTNCKFCSRTHEGGALGCPLVVACESGKGLKNRLATRVISYELMRDIILPMDGSCECGDNR